MLIMPNGAASIASIIGIDPGSDTLGLCVLRFDTQSLAIVSTEAGTLVGSKAARGSWATEVHGDRLGRIESHRQRLLAIFMQVQPLEIACESPFYSQRRPSAFGALTEVVSAIRQAVMQYDAWKQLYVIDPPTIKKAVGTNGAAGKEEVKQAILRLHHLNYNGSVPIQSLDEHSVDAIGVAYCRYQSLMEYLCLKKQ